MAAAPAPGGPTAPETIKAKHLEKAKKAALKQREEKDRAAAMRRAAEDAPLADPIAEKARLAALQVRRRLAAQRQMLAWAAAAVPHNERLSVGSAGGQRDES